MEIPAVGQNWKCPYCGHAQVIASERRFQEQSIMYLSGWEGGDSPGQFTTVVACANTSCRKITLNFDLTTYVRSQNGNYTRSGTVKKWNLLPSSFAKPQPSFIPEPLRRDYEEACAIRDLSPKASATLIRRCIQGIIRDFCGIQLSDNRLISEIRKLRDLIDAGNAPVGVQSDTVDAIDHVRRIGNIGAHMESDINVIVDVDPDEAQILIELTELLFDEWYVAGHERTERIAKIQMIGDAKALQKQQKPQP